MRIIEEFPYPVEVIEHTLIPMADGISLAARIWLPKDAASTPLPALFVYIPYRKRDITRVRDSQNFYYLAGHGYVCVRVDLRGSGDSEGRLPAF
jgi:predicted acyl esterase